MGGSLVKWSGLVKSVTKVVTGCLRMTKVTIHDSIGLKTAYSWIWKNGPLSVNNTPFIIFQEIKTNFQDLQDKLQPKKKFGFKGNKKRQTAPVASEEIKIKPKNATAYQTEGKLFWGGMFYCYWICYNYSGDLKFGLVWISNSRKEIGMQMVCVSNEIWYPEAQPFGILTNGLKPLGHHGQSPKPFEI